MQQLQLIGSSAVKKTVVETSEALTAWPEYPAAIRGGGFVFLSGVRGGRASFSPAAYAEIPAKGFAKPQGYPLVDGGEEAVAVDAWTAHQNMEMILAAAGTRSDQLVRQYVAARQEVLSLV
jgi:hypothetical protein